MPSAAAKSGPIGMTMTKSRMLTNCTAATSSTTARSRRSSTSLGCHAASVGADLQRVAVDDGGAGVAGHAEVVGAGGGRRLEQEREVADAAVVVEGQPGHRRVVEPHEGISA